MYDEAKEDGRRKAEASPRTTSSSRSRTLASPEDDEWQRLAAGVGLKIRAAI